MPRDTYKWAADGLIDGSAPLNSILRADLQDGDQCVVIKQGDCAYHYVYDGLSEAPQDVPNVIAPQDAGANPGRWILHRVYDTGSVSDEAYDATNWNGVISVAPSKNAVRDKIETLMNKDGSNLAIGSDADGDMYYRASGVLARVSEANRGMLLAAHLPGTYSRNEPWTGGASTDAASRRTLVSPSKLAVYIGSAGYVLTSATSLDLNTSANWDNSDYATAANRAGKDFYIYACIPSSGVEADVLLSDNASAPAGKTTSNSRKVGGFHCLVTSVGTIADHTLTDYLQGDILPASVWDLVHRPRCDDTRGMVYSPSGHWVDIYLSSIDSGQLASISGAAFVTGDTAVKFHWYKFSQWLGRIGKRMPTQTEFQALSIGSNQGTNIAGSANPVTTGGHSDTAGRRMISNIGCEDCCGVLWQWGGESGAGGSAAWADAFDAHDAGVAGQHYLVPNRPRFGGCWNNGAYCGSRGAIWNSGPLFLHPTCGVRGVAEPL